ncbi:MAG: hypothetical protein IJD79_09280, partial [Clostridia bacterium]|nr:hypothetical protein [Clostridia bacterium]
MKKKFLSLICLCSILLGMISALIPIQAYAANEEAIEGVGSTATADTSVSINNVSAYVLDSGEFQVAVDATNGATYKLYELTSGATEYSLVAESEYPVIIADSFESTSTYAVSVTSFNGAETEKFVIEHLDVKSASYNPNNVFEGKEFIGAANAPSTGTTYAYSKLTDGIIDRDNIANGRFACTKNRQADGTLDLGGKYLLSNLRIYVFGIEYGTNLTIDVFANGEWKTVFFKETVAEIKEYLNASDNCLYIDLGAVEAEKVRFYAKTSAETEYYVSYFEMECSGILVEDFGEYNENILADKQFKPTKAASALIYGSAYDYSMLTDGVFAQFSGRFSTKKEGYADVVFADAIVNLDGEYTLSQIRFYDYVAKNDYSENTATLMGKNFKLEVFSEGKWVTVASYAENADIQANHRVKSGKTGDGEGWIEFDLENTKATAIKFYSETAGNSVSMFEIECSGYKIENDEENILIGKEFVPTDAAYSAVYGDMHGTYGYVTLTDGNKSATSGRFSSKMSSVADATVDLGGEYELSYIRFYDFVKDTTYETLTENYMGNNFKLEVLSGNEWITVVSYATPTDIIGSHRIRTGNTGHSQGWLDIGFDGIVGSKIRFSSKAVGSTVSINEIECFGTKLVEYGGYSDNILLNKTFTAATNSGPIFSTSFDYDKLTNGVVTGNDRLSTKVPAVIDATVDLGGEYVLDIIKFYDFYNSTGSATFLGQNFKLDVLSHGRWITVYNYAQNADIEANHRRTVKSGTTITSQWLEFDLRHIMGEKIRFYTESVDGTNAISIREITCSCYSSVTDLSPVTKDNLLAGASGVLINGTESSSNSLSNATDGSTDTYFEANAANTYTVEYDLGYIRSVHELKIYELIDPANIVGGVLSTASDKTTVEVYHNGEWLKVISEVALDADSNCNTFKLYDVECSKIRITFKNTRLFDTETAYRCAKIAEIVCTYRNIGADRRPTLAIYEKIDKLTINTAEHSNAMNKFRNYLIAPSMTKEIASYYTEEMKAYYETAIKNLVSGISFAPKTSITLGDSIVLNVYVPADSLIKFTFNNVVYD